MELGLLVLGHGDEIIITSPCWVRTQGSAANRQSCPLAACQWKNCNIMHLVWVSQKVETPKQA